MIPDCLDPLPSSSVKKKITIGSVRTLVDRLSSQATRWTTAALLLAAGYVVLIPSMSPVTLLDLYNDKRLLQVILLVVSGGALLLSTESRRCWLDTFARLPWMAKAALSTVLGLGVISSALSPAWTYAALELGHIVSLFVLAGVVATVTREAPRLANRLLVGAVVLSAFLYAVHFFVSYGMSIVMPALEVGRESIGGFANIRHFNQYQTWILPLLIGAAGATQWRTGRILVLLLAGLWWCLILASDVRGTIVALALASVLVWGLFRQRAHRWLGTHVVALFVGGVLYLLLFSMIGDASPDVAKRMESISSDSWRIHRWESALDLSLSYPWFGAGPMHYAWPPYHFEPGAHPHNAFLQWLSEWGIPSTAVVTCMVVYGGSAWIQVERNVAGEERSYSDSLRIGLVSSLLAGAAHAMVSGLIVMPVSQVLLALLGGWAWGRFQSYRSQLGHVCRNSRRHHIIFCCVLVLSLASLSSGVSDLRNISERRWAYLEAGAREAYWPRYWQQGYIGVRNSSVVQRASRKQ